MKSLILCAKCKIIGEFVELMNEQEENVKTSSGRLVYEYQVLPGLRRMLNKMQNLHNNLDVHPYMVA